METLRKIEERVPSIGGEICPLREPDRLAGQLLSFADPALAGENPGPDGPPRDLRDDVFGGGRLRAGLGECIGLVVPTLLVDRPPEQRRVVERSCDSPIAIRRS